jgi:hypothetical protein
MRGGASGCIRALRDGARHTRQRDALLQRSCAVQGYAKGE